MKSPLIPDRYVGIPQHEADVVPSMEVTSCSLSLICPLGQRRLRDPVLGARHHQQAFDRTTFTSYVAGLQYPNSSRCPVCMQPCSVGTLRPSKLYVHALGKAAPDALSSAVGGERGAGSGRFGG